MEDTVTTYTRPVYQSIVSKQTQTCSAQGSNGGLVPWVMVGPKIIVQNCTRPSSSTLFNPTKISFLFLYIALCSVEKTEQQSSREQDQAAQRTSQSSVFLVTPNCSSVQQSSAERVVSRVQRRGREGWKKILSTLMVSLHRPL